MDARRGSCCVAALAAWLPVLAAAAGPAPAAAPDRFRLASSIRPVVRSADERFLLLTAEVRAAPAAMSKDQRFTLKALHIPEVGCDPLAGDIFADGFEGP